MKTYAQIASRSVRISGHPYSGWRVAGPDDRDVQVLNFRFSITDDGNENFLFAYSSLDNRYAADSWHETIDEAFQVADEVFEIKRLDWAGTNTV